MAALHRVEYSPQWPIYIYGGPGVSKGKPLGVGGRIDGASHPPAPGLSIYSCPSFLLSKAMRRLLNFLWVGVRSREGGNKEMRSGGVRIRREAD